CRSRSWGVKCLPTSPSGIVGYSEPNLPRALRLTLLAGYSVERGGFLLHVLAAALGAFRICVMFFQGENQFEGFVTIVADVVVHGHVGLPLDSKRATVEIVRRSRAACP